MEVVRKFALLLSFVLSVFYPLNAQRIEKGLVKTELTISPAKMLASNHANFYMHGSLDIYLSSKYSFSSSTYFYLGELNSELTLFEQNHSIFYGISRHFVKGKSDAYISFQPGFALTQLQNNDLIVFAKIKRETAINPMASIAAGYNFFVAGIFHFFTELRFVAGNHNTNIRTSLSEIRFSAGLGFNINTIRSK
ncbi:MAG: hypothetical protein R2850_06115 [Bacteroidia bacterium]